MGWEEARDCRYEWSAATCKTSWLWHPRGRSSRWRGTFSAGFAAIDPGNWSDAPTFWIGSPCSSRLDERSTKDTLRVGVVHLPQNLFRKTHTVYPPASLRRHSRRRVVEVFVFCFKEPVVDPIEIFAEYLLWRLDAEWNRIGTEQHAILVAVEEPRCRARLP